MNPLLSSQSFTQIAAPVGAIVSAAAATYMYGMFSPTCRLFGPIITRGQDDSPRIAITFDDGPTPGGTAPILDILDSLHCHATFFFIGFNATQHPDLVRRTHLAGHQIENHSFDHPRLGVFRRAKYWRTQLQSTDQAISAAGGPKATRYFRPPMGFKTWRMFAAARESGHQFVAWSLRGMDGFPTSRDAILNRIVPKAQPGDIIALHDGHEPRRNREPAATIEALPLLIQSLRDKGLTPVRLDDLLTPATSDAATARAT